MTRPTFSHLTTFSPERIQTLAREVIRRGKARRDVLADRASLKVHVIDNALALEVGGLGAAKDQSELFAFRRGSVAQLADTLDVPLRHVDRLVDAGHLDLAANTLNGILSREPKRHLVRLLDGKVDAVLSDAYRAFRNEDLLIMALAAFKELNAEVWDLRVTDDEFRVVAVAPHVSGQVSLDRTFDPGDGWLSRWAGQQGDAHNAAITLGNSETGRGAFFAQPSVLRKVCQNFNAWGDKIATVHLGAKQKDAGEVFVSEETRRMADRVVFARMKDAIKNTFDPVKFAERIALLNATTQVAVPKATEWVDASISSLALPEELREAILEEFLSVGDKSQFGLAQAITAQANPKNRGSRPDELVSQLEDAGGQLLNMTPKEFLALVPA